MTLMPFTPQELDNLALHFLDLAATLRHMANKSRENELDSVPLHVNKVNEWLGHLDDWAVEASGKLETAVIKQRGARRAQSLPYPQAESAPARRSAGKKKTSKK